MTDLLGPLILRLKQTHTFSSSAWGDWRGAGRWGRGWGVGSGAGASGGASRRRSCGSWLLASWERGSGAGTWKVDVSLSPGVCWGLAGDGEWYVCVWSSGGGSRQQTPSPGRARRREGKSSCAAAERGGRRTPSIHLGWPGSPGRRPWPAWVNTASSFGCRARVGGPLRGRGVLCARTAVLPLQRASEAPAELVGTHCPPHPPSFWFG